MTSLLELIKQRYLSTIQSVDSRWKILLVDAATEKSLYSVLTIYEILELGVQQVTLVSDSSSSSSSSNLQAIYLLLPTAENVDLVLRDHSPPINAAGGGSASTPTKQKKNSILSSNNNSSSSSRNRGPPKYSAAHVHFIDGLPDELAQKLTSSLPSQYLLALTELFVNFHPIEPRAFSLKSPRTFNMLYAPSGRNSKETVARWENELRWMAKSIVNALATLGEYPLIRYYNPPTSTHRLLGPAASAGSGESLCKKLATYVQRELDDFARDNDDFPPKSFPSRPRGMLYITDRSMDLFAPLLHEFTYQAMCHDLLNIGEEGDYHYSFTTTLDQTEEKSAILNDKDTIWTSVRHMHMKDALDKLVGDVNAYAGEHGGTFGNNNGKTSLNDMRDMMASLPQLKEVKDKLSLHISMAEKCMAMFESKKLPSAASVEQCCATGKTPEGGQPKTLVEEMVPLLDDRSVSNMDKLRIIAIYIMHRDGVPEGDLKRLYEHARLAIHEMDSINNLSFLGVDVAKETGKVRKPHFKYKARNDAYDGSRYQPSVKLLLEEHFTNTLDTSLFPYVRDAPPVTSVPSVLARLASSTSTSSSFSASTTGAPGSLRSTRATWAEKNTSSASVDRERGSAASKRGTSASGSVSDGGVKQRVIVFVAGGMTYSEIRSAYEVSDSGPGKDVFIGSTSTLTPATFINDLAQLDAGASTRVSMVSTGYEARTKERLSSMQKESQVQRTGEAERSRTDKDIRDQQTQRLQDMAYPASIASSSSSSSGTRNRLLKSNSGATSSRAPPQDRWDPQDSQSQQPSRNERMRPVPAQASSATRYLNTRVEEDLRLQASRDSSSGVRNPFRGSGQQQFSSNVDEYGAVPRARLERSSTSYQSTRPSDNDGYGNGTSASGNSSSNLINNRHSYDETRNNQGAGRTNGGSSSYYSNDSSDNSGGYSNSNAAGPGRSAIVEKEKKEKKKGFLSRFT